MTPTTTNPNRLLPPLLLGRLLLEHSRLSAGNDALFPELREGVRVSLADGELLFESFVSYRRPLVTSTIPYGHPPRPFSCVVRCLPLARLCGMLSKRCHAITIDGTDQGVTLKDGDGIALARVAALPVPGRFPVGRLVF